MKLTPTQNGQAYSPFVTKAPFSGPQGNPDVVVSNAETRDTWSPVRFSSEQPVDPEPESTTDASTPAQPNSVAQAQKPKNPRPSWPARIKRGTVQAWTSLVEWAQDRVGYRAPVTSGQALLQTFPVPYHFDVYRPGAVQHTIEAPHTLKSIQHARLVALGDLHASVQKLMETLVVGDFIEASPTTLKRFRRDLIALHHDILKPVQVPGLSEADQKERMVSGWDDRQQRRVLKHVRALEAHIKAIRWKNDRRQLLLVGDVIGDRGPLDLVTLSLINHLRQGHPDRILALASNHDHDVYDQLVLNRSSVKEPIHKGSFLRSKMLEPHLNPGELRESIHRYLVQSKLAWYDAPSGTLFSHAPVAKHYYAQLNQDSDMVRYQADHPLPSNPKPSQRIEQWVAGANHKYQAYVQAGFEDLVNSQSLRQRGNFVFLPSGAKGEFHQFLQHFLWDEDPLDEAQDLPFYQQGVSTLVHGHRDSTKESPFSYSAHCGDLDDTAEIEVQAVTQPEKEPTVDELASMAAAEETDQPTVSPPEDEAAINFGAPSMRTFTADYAVAGLDQRCRASLGMGKPSERSRLFILP